MENFGARRVIRHAILIPEVRTTRYAGRNGNIAPE